MEQASPYEEQFASCETLLREHDHVCWLAALFAPVERRKYIHALYAFSHEIARIRAIVSDPQLGEIRMQWWSEALTGARAAEAAANPVSAALLKSVTDCKLPAGALTSLIEARRFDLYNDPMPSLNDLEGYCGETIAAMFRMASIALCAGDDPGGAEVCGHAGVALGITRLLQALPQHAARGQCYVPKDILDRHGALPEAVAAGLHTQPLTHALAELRDVARDHLRSAQQAMNQLDERARPSLVLLSQVMPVLERMERRAYNPFSSDINLPQWRSQYAMWRWPSR